RRIARACSGGPGSPAPRQTLGSRAKPWSKAAARCIIWGGRNGHRPPVHCGQDEGMAAGDSTPSFDDEPSGAAVHAFAWPGAAELDERLLEEIGRAERHGTQLSCLLVVVDNLDEMAGEG